VKQVNSVQLIEPSYNKHDKLCSSLKHRYFQSVTLVITHKLNTRQLGYSAKLRHGQNLTEDSFSTGWSFNTRMEHMGHRCWRPLMQTNFTRGV